MPGQCSPFQEAKKKTSSWQQRSPLFLCCILETTTNCRFLKVRTTYNRWFFLKFYVSRCFTWKVKGHFPALGLLPWFPARQELGIHSHLPQGNRYPISWNSTRCLPRCPGTENWDWKQIQNLNPDTDIRWGNPKHRLTHWWCYFLKIHHHLTFYWNSRKNRKINFLKFTRSEPC